MRELATLSNVENVVCPYSLCHPSSGTSPVEIIRGSCQDHLNHSESPALDSSEPQTWGRGKPSLRDPTPFPQGQ